MPEGTNISVVCKGPPGAATFRLYRGGPGGAVGQRWVARGGAVSFSLGPLHPRDEGAYFCTYSPEMGGLSKPSPSLLIPVEGEGGGGAPCPKTKGGAMKGVGGVPKFRGCPESSGVT